MSRLFRSIFTAAAITAAVQVFTVCVLSANLPRTVGRPDAQEYRTFRLPPAELLHIVNTNGTVQVRAVDVAEITIEADIRAYNRGELDANSIKAYVASMVRVNNGQDSFDVISEPEDIPDHLEVRVDYSVLVPEETDLEVSEVNGNIWIAKGCGAIKVFGRNSDIEVASPEGAVNAESINGRIRVTDAPQGATIKTVNGNVYAHMLGGPLEAVTTNGAIVARVLDPEVESCKLSSQNGGITLLLPEGCSAAVKAVTTYGAIKSDFDLKASDGKCRKRRLHGTIGSGDTKVNIETLNGNIWVAKSE
jgi:hypothetical protein